MTDVSPAAHGSAAPITEGLSINTENAERTNSETAAKLASAPENHEPTIEAPSPNEPATLVPELPVETNFTTGCEFMRALGIPPTVTAIYVDPETGKELIDKKTKKSKRQETKSFWDADGGSDYEAAEAWAEARIGKANLYYNINPTRAPMSKKAEKTDVETVGFLQVDLDPRLGEPPEEAIARHIKKLEAYSPLPTAIVVTGNGVQGLWKLKTPEPITGTTDAERRACAADLELYSIQIERDLGGDDCHNVDRIFRLPSTFNLPNAAKLAKGRTRTLSYVHTLEPPRVYDLSDFKKGVKVRDEDGEQIATSEETATAAAVVDLDADPRTKSLAPRAKQIIRDGSIPGETPQHCGDNGDTSRSAWLWDAVWEMCAAGLSKADVKAIITDKRYRISAVCIEKPREIERAINGVFTRAHHPKIAELNEDYFVLTQYDGKCRVAFFEMTTLGRKVLRLQSFEDFEHAHMNEHVVVGQTGDGKPITKTVGKYWLEHKLRRQYKTLVFVPGGDEVIGGCLNMWTGFGATVYDTWPSDRAPPEQCCDLYLKHLKDNVCVDAAGRPVSEYFDYMLNWMARSVQYPELPGKVVPVLKGDEGVGKGVTNEEWRGLFGSHGLTVTNPRHLVGNFNAHLRDCVALHGNEAFYAGDKQHENVLKTLVTDGTLIIEPKGVNSSLGANHLSMMMSSNEAWVVPMNESARRFWVLTVAKHQRKNVAYFKAITKQMNEGGREALLYLLLHRDISQFNVEDFPDTEAGAEQKEITRGPLADRLAGLTGEERAEEFDKATESVHWVERITTNHILYKHLEAKHLEAVALARQLPKAMQSLGWSGPKKIRLREGPVLQGYVRPCEPLGDAQGDMWRGS